MCMNRMRKMCWVSWQSRRVHGGLHIILMCAHMWTFISHFCVDSHVGVLTMNIYGSFTVCLERIGAHLWPGLFMSYGLDLAHFMRSVTLKKLFCTFSHWEEPISCHTVHFHFYSKGGVCLIWATSCSLELYTFLKYVTNLWSRCFLYMFISWSSLSSFVRIV